MELPKAGCLFLILRPLFLWHQLLLLPLQFRLERWFSRPPWTLLGPLTTRRRNLSTHTIAFWLHRLGWGSSISGCWWARFSTAFAFFRLLYIFRVSCHLLYTEKSFKYSYRICTRPVVYQGCCESSSSHCPTPPENHHIFAGYNSCYVRYNTPDLRCDGWWVVIDANKVDLPWPFVPPSLSLRYFQFSVSRY